MIAALLMDAEGGAFSGQARPDATSRRQAATVENENAAEA
jgi:hypothetical protein